MRLRSIIDAINEFDEKSKGLMEFIEPKSYNSLSDGSVDEHLLNSCVGNGSQRK